MASYNTVITNEGAALLASVIANQGTLTFSEMRFSTTDYDGVEQTLTVGTFAGVFITAAAAGSVVDATTIKVGAQFDNSGIVGDHPLYSIGIVGTDGNTTALIAVCTTTNPDIIRAALTGVSTYAFNVNLAVSSTLNITVAGTTAAALYDIDIVDTLTSTATNKPLSANQGRVLEEQAEAMVNVLGAKNLNSYPYYETTKSTGGIIYTDNGDGTITISGGIASADSNFRIHYSSQSDFYLKAGEYIVSGCPSGGSNESYFLNFDGAKDYGDGATYLKSNDGYISITIGVLSGSDFTTPLTFKPMIRDARILDPTFAPYAQTNLQLTNNVSGLSNRNFLDNGWFTVNQRGSTSGTMSGNKYYYDRWIFTYSTNPGSFVETSNGVKLTPALNDSVQWWQYLDNPIALSGKALTISILFGDGSIKHGSLVRESGTYQNIMLDSNTQLQVSINTTDRVAFYVKSEVIIRAVKLEVGSVSTLHLDVAPDYTEELLKCQRYFERIKLLGSANSYALFGIGYADSTAVARVIIWCQPKRALPTLSFTGSFYLGTNAVTGMAAQQMTNAGIAANVASSGLVQDNLYVLTSSNTGYYIDLSADL